jgi:hypothetical protein
MPDDAGLPLPFGDHPADATVARIAARVLALPRDDAIWQEAAAVNAIKLPLDAALRRGDITLETYQRRLRVVSGPVLARAGRRASEVLIAATVLLSEAAPLPDSAN